ncbi:MAG: hypothetical protein B6I18_08680 [Bacteroidetes bacterium 4572_112]|nr:MAG: hypothetical protein B6I18_08680 [Bacteroidetes bacterium 4572_112]
MIRFLLKIPRSTYLLISILIFIFINPLLVNTSFHQYANIISYSIIFFTTNFAIKKRTLLIKSFLYIGILLQVILLFSEINMFLIGSFFFSGMVFIIVTTLLILQIARTKEINLEIIIEAVSGYLLIGIVATILNSILLLFNSEAISFNSSQDIGDTIYYSFITLTTIGYGEILPISPMARNISLITGITGQLYLTIIIAVIVGKVSSSSNK